MKKQFLTSLLFFCSFFFAKAQVTIWQETFDPAPLAGWNLNTSFGTNDTAANYWQINDDEGGVAAGNCGLANNGNNTLFIGATLISPGAAYNAGGLCPLVCVTTNKRAESPAISTVGNNATITLSFDYIEGGDLSNDDFFIQYSTNNGTTWNLLSNPAKTSVVAACSGQGYWTAYSIALPATCQNIANLKLGFCWKNNDDGVGSDPSVAINNVKLTVPNSNTQPNASNDVANINCNTSITISPLSNDTDPNAGQMLSLSNTITTGLQGSASIMLNSIVYTPPSGWFGTTSFQYVVCDNGSPSLCDTATIIINVANSGCNVAPLAADDTIIVGCGIPSVVKNVLLNDTDPNGNTMTVSALLGTTGLQGTLSFLSNGSVTFTPTSSTAPYVFVAQYKVCDNGSPVKCDTANIALLVTGCNQPPVANVDIIQTACNTSILLNPLNNDSDPNPGQSLSFTIIGNPAHGTIVGSSTNQLAYLPANCYSGKDTVYYRVCDNDPVSSMCDTGLIAITVLTCNCDTNSKPQAFDDLVNTNCNTQLTFDPRINDKDSNVGQQLFLSQLVSNAKHGVATVDAFNNKIIYTPANCYSGIDTLEYAVCDNGSPAKCDTATVYITVGVCSCAVPVADFKASKVDICVGDCISFLDLSTNIPNGWQWTFQGATPNSSTAQNPNNICYAAAGNYDVTLVAKNQYGNSNPATKQLYITVHSAPNSSSETRVDTIGSSVVLNAGISGMASYVWSPSTGLSNTSIANPVATISGDIVYTCTYYNQFGCKGTKTIAITSVKAAADRNVLLIPNAFSPNADGDNDEWLVKSKNIVSYKAIIANRWGNIVFSTTDPTQGWNGTANGVDHHPSTYFYYIKATFKDGEVIEKKGDIMVVY